MEIQLPESERRWLHAVLVIGTLVLSFVLISQVAVLLAYFSDILLILLLAWLLAFMLSPLVGRILRAFPKLPRIGVVAVVYLAMFLILSWIALVVAGNLANSIAGFVSQLPDFQARLPDILAPIQNTLTSLGFQVDAVTAARQALGNLGEVGGNLVGPLTDLALFSLGIVGNLLIIVFLSLFIVIDKDRILAYLNRLVPPQYSETARLFETSVAASFGGFIRGQSIQGLTFAVVAAGVHLVFGLDYLPASAALVGVLQAIPFFGPLLSWAPPVIVAILTKPDVVVPVLLAMFAGWFVINNLLLPRVMAHAVGIHPVVVLVAVLLGLKVAGVAGAVFALPFTAILAAFFHHFLARNANVPRDVTTRAAKLVGEREGRAVRVPQPPPVGVAGAAVPTEPLTDDIGEPTRKPPSQTTAKPAEPTA